MSSVYRGLFVISWSQTEVDSFVAPGLGLVAVGATWRWTGQAVRVDHPASLLVLDPTQGGVALRRRAARMVRRLIGAATAPQGAIPDADEDEAVQSPEQGFTLTDGRRTWVASVLPVRDSAARLVMFVGEMPPQGRDLWIVATTLDLRVLSPDPVPQGGVICFASGTMISTPSGPCPIEMLRPGDRIDTVDSGPQPVVWTGHRWMSGARLYVMPHLRPVRVRSAALGGGRPDVDLLVSPQHRLMLRGAAADALFGTPEVLVRACDMVGDAGVMIDQTLREVTYIHIMLEAHHLVLANGLESESFHPQSAALETLDPAQREALAAILPDARAYGAPARRMLSASETAILRHDVA